MAGRLKRRGRDATLRALKVESLLNLKRPRKNWGSRARVAHELGYSRKGRGLGGWVGGALSRPSDPPVLQVRNARR